MFRGRGILSVVDFGVFEGIISDGPKTVNKLAAF